MRLTLGVTAAPRNKLVVDGFSPMTFGGRSCSVALRQSRPEDIEGEIYLRIRRLNLRTVKHGILEVGGHDPTHSDFKHTFANLPE